ncbi:uncharacterized protein VP01_5797g1 [Puccinia sorghi]|uniref:CxC1-like cysteine cluster associated with KDZ transposases domain-containing protein n=1 Tax=Puccinia sorghi TaxID=27349 RepID=A0A0L6UI83_9BASI|nr:uncharacterized protein VP01_5797g1 [Puccinia sorghi]
MSTACNSYYSSLSKLADYSFYGFSGQKIQMVPFCLCMPDTIFLLSRGYIASTPVFPQTAVSVCVLNFHELLWNLCNAHTTPIADPWDLQHNLGGSIYAYRYLIWTQKQMIETVISPHPQDRLVQCTYSRKIYLCLDGNFQHQHHACSEKGHLALQKPVLFIPPEELQRTKKQIRESEINLRKSDHAIFHEINSASDLQILYDIGCSLDKFMKIQQLLPQYSTRMKFGTSIFHSYVHNCKFQLAYNPRLNEGWGLMVSATKKLI